MEPVGPPAVGCTPVAKQPVLVTAKVTVSPGVTCHPPTVVCVGPPSIVKWGEVLSTGGVLAPDGKCRLTIAQNLLVSVPVAFSAVVEYEPGDVYDLPAVATSEPIVETAVPTAPAEVDIPPAPEETDTPPVPVEAEEPPTPVEADTEPAPVETEAPPVQAEADTQLAPAEAEAPPAPEAADTPPAPAEAAHETPTDLSTPEDEGTRSV